MNEFPKRKGIYDRQLIEDEVFHIEGYPEKMKVEFAYEDGVVVPEKQIVLEKIFPMFEATESGTDFLFMPIHFRNRTVGYFVIKNAVYLMEKQYLFQVVNALNSAMENLHRKEMLEYMNKELAELYVRDPMTSLYNRVGYQKMAVNLFDRMKYENRNMVIMYIDMDRLKYINDEYGHLHGDFAIKTIGSTILKYSPEKSIPVRLGGDEFMVILPEGNTALADKLAEEICTELEMVKTERNLPYPLSVSIGYVCTDMSTEKELDDYLREADEVMYQKKVLRKMNREV